MWTNVLQTVKVTANGTLFPFKFISPHRPRESQCACISSEAGIANHGCAGAEDARA
jgi:hypothetical protein